jgi:hypothetical protein
VGTSRRGNRKWEGEGRGIWSVYFIYLNKNKNKKKVSIIYKWLGHIGRDRRFNLGSRCSGCGRGWGVDGPKKDCPGESVLSV